jgi:hypothetical protein
MIKRILKRVKDALVTDDPELARREYEQDQREGKAPPSPKKPSTPKTRKARQLRSKNDVAVGGGRILPGPGSRPPRKGS